MGVFAEVPGFHVEPYCSSQTWVLVPTLEAPVSWQTPPGISVLCAVPAQLERTSITNSPLVDVRLIFGWLAAVHAEGAAPKVTVKKASWALVVYGAVALISVEVIWATLPVPSDPAKMVDAVVQFVSVASALVTGHSHPSAQSPSKSTKPAVQVATSQTLLTHLVAVTSASHLLLQAIPQPPQLLSSLDVAVEQLLPSPGQFANPALQLFSAQLAGFVLVEHSGVPFVVEQVVPQAPQLVTDVSDVSQPFVRIPSQLP